mmetsp:Transcript_13640/g.24706  ORF Transcript_13640/g.24706 Transcript_13640/m.24706 type:complete len:207 (+) Transcript_13640:2896-3516(+)
MIAIGREFIVLEQILDINPLQEHRGWTRGLTSDVRLLILRRASFGLPRVDIDFFSFFRSRFFEVDGFRLSPSAFPSSRSRSSSSSIVIIFRGGPSVFNSVSAPGGFDGSIGRESVSIISSGGGVGCGTLPFLTSPRPVAIADAMCRHNRRARRLHRRPGSTAPTAAAAAAATSGRRIRGIILLVILRFVNVPHGSRTAPSQRRKTF